MDKEIDQEELEELERLEFNNHAMRLIADQCVAAKKDGEAEILESFIRVNESRIAYLRSRNTTPEVNMKHVLRLSDEQKWAHHWIQNWGLFDRMERLLHG
jgi:hypothetical protein